MRWTVSDQPAKPFYPSRITNFLGRFRKPLLFNATEILGAASGASKLRTECVHGDILSALEVFCSAINEDTDIHYFGKKAIQQTIGRDLITRLLIQDTINQHAEILDVSIKKPIMILGEPRAGTTLLHRLLAKDPQFRATLFWEVIYPIPPPDPKTYFTDNRIKKTKKLIKKVIHINPYLEITHPMGATLPEECWPLLHRSFIRPLDCLFLNIPKYQDWMLSRRHVDLTSDYRFYRTQLQVLQWKFPRAQFVLKSPVHGFFLPVIAEVFPDIRFIHCHRDPKETVPSVCSLAASRAATYYSKIDFKQLGKHVISYGKARIERVMAAREDIDSNYFYDIAFSQMLKNPMATVKSLYEWLNLTLEHSVEMRMKNYLESQQKGEYRKHSYSLNQFGLVQSEIDLVFESYQEMFQSYLPRR